jgi:hypothetical protein
MKRFLVLLLAIGFFVLAQIARADWTPAKRITWTAFDSYNPAIAIDPSNAIHVVWDDEAIGYAEIYYKRSADGGTTWSATKRLTWTSYASGYPAIAIDSSNKIHVVLGESPPGNWRPEMYYRKSIDGGTTWSALKRLTWTSGSSDEAAIDIDSTDTIHIAWSDDTPGNFEIYYKNGK